MKSLILLFSLLTFSNSTMADEIVIDGTSTTTIKSSISNMIKNRPDEEKKEFIVALIRIQLSDVKSAYELPGNKEQQSINFQILGPKIDGLTYDEIQALADKSPTKAEIKP